MTYPLALFQTNTSVFGIDSHNEDADDDFEAVRLDDNQNIIDRRHIVVSFPAAGFNRGTIAKRLIHHIARTNGPTCDDYMGIGAGFSVTPFPPYAVLIIGLGAVSAFTDGYASVCLGSGRDVVPFGALDLKLPELKRPRLIDVSADISKFETLRNKWREERGVSSSTIDIVTCDSYQKIIGMGERALPHIFLQMQKEGDKPDQWFWALRMITQENPVPRESWGKRKEMVKYWLQWAVLNGFLKG